METRITLSKDEFATLVRGQEVRHATGSSVVRIILADIGFQAMTAEINLARRTTDDQHRREALASGRCRYCGKGGLESFAGAARCTACGRLQ